MKITDEMLEQARRENEYLKLINENKKLKQEFVRTPQVEEAPVEEAPVEEAPVIQIEEAPVQAPKPLSKRDDILLKVGNRDIITMKKKKKNKGLNRDATASICKVQSHFMKRVGEHYKYQLLFHEGNETFATLTMNYNKKMANGEIAEIPIEMLTDVAISDMMDIGEPSYIEQLITKGTFTSVEFIAIPKVSDEGGHSPGNNCLLKILGYNENQYDGIKKDMGLSPQDLISISKIPLLEDIREKNILVLSHQYFGCGKYSENVVVNLIDDHYVKVDRRTPAKYSHIELEVTQKRRNLIVFENTPDGTKMYYQSKANIGPKYKTSTRSAVTQLEKDENYIGWKVPDKRMTLENAYNMYHEWEHVIFKATYDKEKKRGWSIFQCSSHQEAIMTYWEYTLPSNIDPINKVNPIVDAFCHNNMKGGLIYGKKGFYTSATEIDVRGFYHFIYKTLRLPRDGGTIYNIDNPRVNKDKLQYGLYEVNITPEECNKETPFRFRYSKIYTHFEINKMKEHDYKFTFGKRCIIWSEKSGIYPLLKNFADKLEYYRKNNKMIKRFVNMMWGMLTKKNFHKEKCKVGGTISPMNIKEIKRVGKDLDNVQVIGNLMGVDYYEHSPTVGFFIVSYARCLMNDIMDKVGRENIVRVHTDGCTITCDVPEGLLGEKLGEMRIENEGSVRVYHANKNIWNERLTPLK